MKKRITAIAAFVSLFYGCSTDFEVIAPYKEVMVVDGLLNAVDSVQYVRISKAFLGEGNAFYMAQQKDSVNYGDVLDVKMERVRSNQVIETFNLTRTEMNDKDSGIFSYPFYVLYKTTQEIHDEDDSEYRITITNTSTGNVVKSQTKIVKDMQVISPVPTDSVDWASASPSPVIVRWNPNPNGRSNSRIFDMFIRFNYREIDPSGNSVFKSIDWDFADQINSVDNVQEIRFVFYKYDFLENIGKNIQEIPGYTRRIDSLPPGRRPIELLLMQGTEDLLTYIDLQKPSTGIVQERPLFTTVENGLGLFTSRLIHIEKRFPNHITQAAFDTSEYTQNLNFQFD